MKKTSYFLELSEFIVYVKIEKWQCERIKTDYYDSYMTLFLNVGSPKILPRVLEDIHYFFVLFLQKYIFLGY